MANHGEGVDVNDLGGEQQFLTGDPGAEAWQSDCLKPEDLADVVGNLGASPSRCLLCEAVEQRELYSAQGKILWICCACELIYVHDIYPEFVEPPLDLPPVETLWTTPPRRSKKFSRWLHELSRHRNNNRLLDVGCGQGEFLTHAEQSGWDATGVDIDPLRVRIAREQRGLSISLGLLDQVNFPSNHFDVVFMSEVIEHVVDPVPLMQEIHRILRPGGVAFVRTGNARSWSARLRGATWDYYRFQFHGHIRYYSPRTAQSLACASGFSRVSSTTQGFAFMEAAEMRGHWFRAPLKLVQAIISPIAGALGKGHRLAMVLHKSQAFS